MFYLNYTVKYAVAQRATAYFLDSAI